MFEAVVGEVEEVVTYIIGWAFALLCLFKLYRMNKSSSENATVMRIDLPKGA